MAEASVAAGFARALVELAAVKGADRAELVARAGIGRDVLEDPDARLPLDRYVALMRTAKLLTGDAALALHFGEAFDISELSIIGLMGQVSPSLADAFSQLGRFGRLMADVELEPEAKGERLVVQRRGGALWLVDMRRNPNDFPELTESGFARAICALRRMSPERPFVQAVHFTHAEPPYRDEYERIFQAPLTFESDRNAFLMANSAWLALKGAAPSPYGLEVLRQRAERLLETLDNGQSMSGCVENLIEPLLHHGGTDMVTIAARLGVSRPTLFRRLRAEGTTFEAVRDGVRRRLALRHLADRKATVSQIAHLLGFSDAAAFSRAFKRWTGKSPRG